MRDEDVPIEQRIIQWLTDEHNASIALGGNDTEDPVSAYFTGQAHAFNVALVLVRCAFNQDRENG